MREALLDSLTKIAGNDADLMLLTGDLGFGVFEEFSERFPKQFLNVGVAEQNMIGVAAGLALSRKKVFVYSIGNFPTLRCLEQIRNDVSYHDLNVNIVAMGGGFSYGSLGMSHHATEDISIMRAIPRVQVFTPSTSVEVSCSVYRMYNNEGASYLRLDKSELEVDGLKESSFYGEYSYQIVGGNDLAILVSGGIVNEVMKAVSHLSDQGINCRVVSMFSISPIDGDAIQKACRETRGVITVEENNLSGGLGSAVAEYCMDNSIVPESFCRIGLPNVFSSVVGDQNYLREFYGMDHSVIVKKAMAML